MSRTKLPVPDVAEVGPGLWSNAIRAGDMLFISGQVARPFEGGTQLVGNNEYEQAKQIFSRIERIIKAAGGTMDNLVKMTIYVVDIKKNTEVWRARREFFTGDFPASTLVEVRSLTKEVLVDRDDRLSGQELTTQLGPHSISSSALTSNVCGTVRPSSLAVLRLTIISNLVGRSTGRSAGRKPCKILPTMVPAWRKVPRRLGP